METHIVKRIQGAGRWDNQYQVVNKKTKEVVSEWFSKSDAKYHAFNESLSDPNHPKHWLYLSTTPNTNVNFK